MNLLLKKALFCLVGLSFCCVSCHDTVALKDALIEQLVQEKIDNHIRKKKETCLKEAMAEAMLVADSVMIQLALNKVDTSGKANRPDKPIRPEIDLPVDTTPIRPLFEDTITTKKE